METRARVAGMRIGDRGGADRLLLRRAAGENGSRSVVGGRLLVAVEK